MNYCVKMNRRINAYDIETLCINEKYIGFCVSFSYEKKIWNFYGDMSIENSILKSIDLLKNKGIIFYVHNLNFDGMLILEYLSRSNFVFDIMAIRTNIYYVRLKLDKIVIEWRCSFKLMPFSLGLLAKEICDLRKMSFPYEILNEKFNDNLQLIDIVKNIDEYKKEDLCMHIKDYTIKYCNNDVILTKKIVEFFWKVMNDFDISTNSANYSISSIAVNLFFRKYNNFGIEKKLDDYIDKYVRNGYYGGRCEVFGNPKQDEKIYHFDFKGMYAQCMLEKFPIGSPVMLFDVNTIDEPGFYHIEWEWKGKYPILPSKDNVFGKLMFFEGKGEGLYWYEEIVIFLKYGGKILKVNSCMVFKNEEYVFKKFVDEIDIIRSKGGVYKMIGKLLVNSMYGRLGMGRDNVSCIVSFDGKPHKNAERFYVMNNVVISEIKKELSFNGISNVVMAAIITSKARIKLYKAFNSVIDNGGRLLYSDTDSVIAAYKRNVDGEKHGEIFWDISKVDTILKKACFALPKTYSVVLMNGQTMTKIKGFRKNSVEFEVFEKIFNENGSIIEESFSSIRKSGFILRNDVMSKETRLHGYSKRRWVENFTDTLPIKR